MTYAFRGFLPKLKCLGNYDFSQTSGPQHCSRFAPKIDEITGNRRASRTNGADHVRSLRRAHLHATSLTSTLPRSPPPFLAPPLRVLFFLSRCRRTVQLLALQFVLGSSIVLPTTPLRSHGAAVIQAGRSGLAQMAYNPQPSKNKPKKIKEKGPKVKAPPSAAAAQQLVPEQTFFEGAPSITETLIPGLSLFTVVGVIPFTASLARQAWTRYKITNKRMEIASGAPPTPTS